MRKHGKQCKWQAQCNPKPAAPAVNGQAPWSATPTSNVPRIGPVQEKETMANVAAIKNIPPIFPSPDFESILLANPDGNPISNNPKKESKKYENGKEGKVQPDIGGNIIKYLRADGFTGT